jgi:F-type H+-transporting ATPase subunit alpha
MVIYAGTKGYIDDVPLARVQEFQNAFLQYVDTSAPQVRQSLAEKKELTDEIEKQLKATLDDFKSKAWKK